MSQSYNPINMSNTDTNTDINVITNSNFGFDVENQQDNIVNTNNFFEKFILQTLLPNVKSEEFLLFTLNINSGKIKFPVFLIMIYQYVTYSIYSNNTNKLFEHLIYFACVNLIWLIFSFRLKTCTTEVNNELINLKQNNINSNKLLIKILNFWFHICIIRIIEFIVDIFSINSFILTLSHLEHYTLNENYSTQFILLLIGVNFQFFLIPTLSHGKFIIYKL